MRMPGPDWPAAERIAYRIRNKKLRDEMLRALAALEEAVYWQMQRQW